MPSTLVITGTVASAPIVAFIWEYIAKTRESNVKPSVVLRKIKSGCENFFSHCGSLVARFSSFFTYIDYHRLSETARELVEPSVGIIVSPFQGFRGYWERMKTYTYPKAILLGTVTILGSIGMIYYFHGPFIIHKLGF